MQPFEQLLQLVSDAYLSSQAGQVQLQHALSVALDDLQPLLLEVPSILLV